MFWYAAKIKKKIMSVSQEKILWLHQSVSTVMPKCVIDDRLCLKCACLWNERECKYMQACSNVIKMSLRLLSDRTNTSVPSDMHSFLLIWQHLNILASCLNESTGHFGWCLDETAWNSNVKTANAWVTECWHQETDEASNVVYPVSEKGLFLHYLNMSLLSFITTPKRSLSGRK